MRQLALQGCALRTVAHDHAAKSDAPRLNQPQRGNERVELLLAHKACDVDDNDLALADAMLRTPEARSFAGIEARRVHPTRPEAEVVPEPVCEQRINHGLTRNVNLAASTVAAAPIGSDKAPHTCHLPRL